MAYSKNFYFDLDGVLVDACDWHYMALNSSLKKNGELEISYDVHLKVFNGLPTKKKLEILGIHVSKYSFIVEDKNYFFNRIMDTNCLLDVSKVELISFLKSKGSKIACVTNSIKSTAESMLKKIGVLNFFDLIVSNEDVPENKPSPYPYNHAIDTLKASEEFNIAVEDSEKGIESASRSNINLVWKVKNAKEVNLINYKFIFGE